MQNNFNISIFVLETEDFMKRKFLFLILIAPLIFLSGFYSKCNAVSFVDQNDTHLKVIVIDPGHGGKDPGATVGNAQEKDVVLDIALKLGNLIKSSFPDIKVIYTRDKDVFIPLYQRANIANRNSADLFISIHANYVNSRSVQGTETFVLGQHRSQDALTLIEQPQQMPKLGEFADQIRCPVRILIGQAVDCRDQVAPQA